RIGSVVGLEFGEFRCAGAEALFACGERLGAAALDIIYGTLDHAQPFHSFHEITFVSVAGSGASFNTASSAAVLCASPVRSWMPCCRNFCMRGHSAMA